tara:strand:+ start:934 stop:1287 length:354 start_codon:yes stop_codon:yes gene_type:complete
MATLAAQILLDRANVFLNTGDFAETITYEGNSITAIVDIGEEEVVDDVGRTTKEIRGTVTVSTSDVSNPAPGDTWVHNSITYTVENVRSQEGGMCECDSVHAHAKRTARQGYRRARS